MSACFFFLNHALGLGLAHAFRPVAEGAQGQVENLQTLPFTCSLDQTRQEDRVVMREGKQCGKQVP